MNPAQPSLAPPSWKELHAWEKRNTVDEEMVGNRAAPTNLVKNPTEIDKRWQRGDADCINVNRREHTILEHQEDLRSVIPSR